MTGGMSAPGHPPKAVAPWLKVPERAAGAAGGTWTGGRMPCILFFLGDAAAGALAL